MKATKHFLRCMVRYLLFGLLSLYGAILLIPCVVGYKILEFIVFDEADYSR